ncbi:hypothetical protein UFOVP183_7 [uncultured Caudovirales phage]|uniref:Uncharacterized protein n=1 Tax=uncultured Caudovirales phage TaxID=2100421 RepID=A0A6J7WD40_9CAUD|nr:hypothetical protein UFOVP183_7 [uncultured Caudovirales phage]
MSFQTLFEIQQSMTVNNRRTVGQQVSRSGQVRVAQYLTSVPWVFTVTPHNYLYYPQVRDVIQTIDNLDRQLPQNIQFNSSNLSWFTAMRGTATAATLATTPAANTQTLTLSSNGTYKAGDFIMINGYTYKVTADSAGTTVNIHRPLITAPSSGTTVFMGNACTFYMLAESCPTYTLNPMTNGAFVQWDGPFVFREDITG